MASALELMLPRGSIADKDASEPEPEAGSSGFVQVVSPVHQCVGDIACHAFGGGGVVASMAVWVGDLEPDCDGSFGKLVISRVFKRLKTDS